jgi:tetratricopeptide (TPR) repeat protein
MNHKISLAVIFCLAASSAFAQENSTAQARKKYDVSDYAGAASLFENALQKDSKNPFLEYDLGNALFKSGKLGLSIVAYQRAFNILPRNGDIRYNLAFALNRAGESLIPSGVPPILFTLFYWLSLQELSGLFWLFTWVLLIFGVFWIKTKKDSDALRLIFPGAAIFCALFGSWWGIRFLLEPESLGVIIAPTAEVRSGPGESFSVDFTAPEGRRVEILSANSDWIEVGLLKEGSRGWVSSQDVEKI